MLPKLTKKNPKWKIAGEIRRSQVVSTSGSGAIVDFPRLSGIMAGIDDWDIFDGSLPQSARFHERNLQKMLGKEFFVQVSTEDNSEKGFALPVYRFPRYYYCPECHMLDNYGKIAQTISSDSEYNSALYCTKCSRPKHPVHLIPSRFIVACQNGHLDDFPYFWWAHKGQNIDESVSHQLSLEYVGNTGGLDSIVVRCSCGAHMSMAGCMDRNALKTLSCKAYMPWLGLGFDKKNWYVDPEGCGAIPRVIQRSANNVYYPVTQSALTIPPWSSKVQQVIKRHVDTIDDIFDEEETSWEQRLKKHYSKYKEEYKCSEQTFLREVMLYHDGEDDSSDVTESSLRISEYNAFCDVDWQENEDLFRTKSTDIPEMFEDYIDEIKIVSRLREVKVLRGFRRILPTYETEVEKRSEQGLLNREFAPLSKQPLKWLPAIQMYGEGIFIKFNEEAISAWEKKNFERYAEMGKRLAMPWVGNGMFDPQKPRYVLLHTLAHLLIRQLTAQCGYVSASLREKIYSTFLNSDEAMSGILIYTSATDSDGSLGGLAREGDGYRLCNTILAMLEQASWCSNDPICIDSKDQGYKSLNYAACHACCLLPETSCESANCLLDRASVVGIPENRDIGFFSKLLDE